MTEISYATATGLLLFGCPCGHLRQFRRVRWKTDAGRFARQGCIPDFPVQLPKKRTNARVTGVSLPLVSRRWRQCDSKANKL
jgi:hypothetical protein